MSKEEVNVCVLEIVNGPNRNDFVSLIARAFTDGVEIWTTFTVRLSPSGAKATCKVMLTHLYLDDLDDFGPGFSAEAEFEAIDHFLVSVRVYYRFHKIDGNHGLLSIITNRVGNPLWA